MILSSIGFLNCWKMSLELLKSFLHFGSQIVFTWAVLMGTLSHMLIWTHRSMRLTYLEREKDFNIRVWIANIKQEQRTPYRRWPVSCSEQGRGRRGQVLRISFPLSKFYLRKRVLLSWIFLASWFSSDLLGHSIFHLLAPSCSPMWLLNTRVDGNSFTVSSLNSLSQGDLIHAAEFQNVSFYPRSLFWLKYLPTYLNFQLDVTRLS